MSSAEKERTVVDVWSPTSDQRAVISTLWRRHYGRQESTDLIERKTVTEKDETIPKTQPDVRAKKKAADAVTEIQAPKQKRQLIE